MVDLLVLGTSRDPHVYKVVSRLRKRGLHCELIDANENTPVVLRQEPGSEIEIKVNGHAINGSCLVWNRPLLWTGSPMYFEGDELEEAFGSGPEWRKIVTFRVGEWSLLLQLVSFLYSRQTINNPHMTRHMNKVLQQAIANKVGLATPRTLLTTAKAEALKFLAADGEYIVKTSGSTFMGDTTRAERLVSIETIFTQRVSENDVRQAAAEQLEACPHMFQHAIPKSYELRVLMIKDAMYAFRINSLDKEYTKVDWRPGQTQLQFDRTTIPAEIASSLARFMEHFDLFTGSFDFVVDDNGQYWFLECNSDGAWGWLDDRVDGQIADEFARAFEEKLSELKRENAVSDPTSTLRKLSYLSERRSAAA